MLSHSQRGTHGTVFYEPIIVDNGNGTLTCPAGLFWMRGMAYPLAAYTPVIGTGPFRLWVEAVGTSADYFLDLLLAAPPVSFGTGIGSHIVAWRDTATDDLHLLRSVNA